jgi:hypothetical protein
MKHFTEFCPESYSAMSHPDSDSGLDYELTDADLLEIAEENSFERYAELIPYSEWEWDMVNHEECDESYMAAMRDLAIRDDYMAYTGEPHNFSDDLKQYAADLLAARAELFEEKEGC